MRQSGADGIDRKVDWDSWKQGFSIGSSHGMTCDICCCLVRQTPADAAKHLAWHRLASGVPEVRSNPITVGRVPLG